MLTSKITFFISPEMLKELRKLSTTTRVKQADYIREGIGIILGKYKAELKKAKKKGG